MRRTGVIVGIHQSITAETADMYKDLLALRYPGVNFTLLQYGDSISFEYDDGEWETPPRGPRTPSVDEYDRAP